MPLPPPSNNAQQSLIKLLIKLKLIDSQQLSNSWRFNDHFPIALLAERGLLNQQEAIFAVAASLGIDAIVIDHDNFTKVINLLDTDNFNQFPKEAWGIIKAVPVCLEQNLLTVAFANPLDLESIRVLEFETGFSIKSAIASEEHILCCLSRKLPNIETEFRNLLNNHNTDHHSWSSAHSALESNLSGDENEAPVIRLVNRILGEGVQAGASDIHLSPEREQLEVRIRVDGILRPILAIPSSLQASVLSRIKLLAGMDISEKRKPQDGRLRIKTPIGARDLRLSSIPTANGENLVIRILSTDLAHISLDNLGIREAEQKQLKRCLTGSSRVILVTGPTGSGKTSTLYAALMSLKDGETNIITIEDPIEYRIAGINQTQVNSKIGVTFAQGLKAVLRQDPDIVMIGEIRDGETAQIAFQAAQTGHLVLSTLHTNSASATVVRLKDIGIPSYIIASSLGAVVAQRLVRKLCIKCSEIDQNSKLEEFSILGLEPKFTRRPVGCSECNHTGYKGRTAIYSILEVNDAVREAIREDKAENVIENCAQDFKSLLQAGIDAINRGTTSIEELERALGSLESHLRSQSVIENIHKQNEPVKKHNTGLKKVVLAEDDENIRTVLSMLLQNEAYQVIEAQDGKEAISKIYENHPDLIICDLMMPKLDGYGVVRHLRATQQFKNLPILMLTAAQTEENEIKLLDIGADDFVGKNSDPKVLISRISRLLNRSNLQNF